MQPNFVFYNVYPVTRHGLIIAGYYNANRDEVKKTNKSKLLKQH